MCARACASIIVGMTDFIDLLVDLPGWLKTLLGPGKLVILLVVFGVAALAEAARRERGNGDAG